MNEFLNKNKLKLSILAISCVMLITSFSYAYFTASVSGNDSASETVVTTGNMQIAYTDGDIIGTPSNMIPGQSIEKTFKVKNTGNVDTSYVIYLSEVINDFNPVTDLEYKLEKLSENGFEMDDYVTTPTGPFAINNVAISISPNEEHEYKLTILFKESNVNQDNNKGKIFKSKIQINEYNRASITINYNANGGVANKLSDSIYSGDAINNFPTAEKASDDEFNYRFLGWYDQADGGNKVSNNTVFVVDTILYAHYVRSPRSCTVKVTSKYNSDWVADYSCVDGVGTMTKCSYKKYECVNNYNNTGPLRGCQSDPGSISPSAYCINNQEVRDFENYSWSVLYKNIAGGGMGFSTISCSCEE